MIRRIINGPAYALELEVTAHRAGTSITLLTIWPTAGAEAHRQFNVSMARAELQALRDALDEALNATT